MKKTTSKEVVFLGNPCSRRVFEGLAPNDSYWVRTSDLYPVKVALSQLS